MSADDEASGGERRALTRRVVGLIREYVARGASAFEAGHGPEALTVVQAIMAALMGQLEGNLGHVVLWEQFLQTPDEVSGALAGVVTELQCRNPAFEEWLAEAEARYQALTSEGLSSEANTV
jgi:hypothetical protein